MDDQKLVCIVKTVDEMKLLGKSLGRFLSSTPTFNDDGLSPSIVALHGPSKTGKTTLVENIVHHFEKGPSFFAEWDRRFPLEKTIQNQKWYFLDYGTTANPLSLASPQRIMQQMECTGEFDPFDRDQSPDRIFLEHSTFPGTLLANTVIMMADTSINTEKTARYYGVLSDAFTQIAEKKSRITEGLIKRAMATQREGILKKHGAWGFCPKAKKKQVKEALQAKTDKIAETIYKRQETMRTCLLPEMKTLKKMSSEGGPKGRVVCVVNTSPDKTTQSSFKTLKKSLHLNGLH